MIISIHDNSFNEYLKYGHYYLQLDNDTCYTTKEVLSLLNNASDETSTVGSTDIDVITTLESHSFIRSLDIFRNVYVPVILINGIKTLLTNDIVDMIKSTGYTEVEFDGSNACDIHDKTLQTIRIERALNIGNIDKFDMEYLRYCANNLRDPGDIVRHRNKGGIYRVTGLVIDKLTGFLAYTYEPLSPINGVIQTYSQITLIFDYKFILVKSAAVDKFDMEYLRYCANNLRDPGDIAKLGLELR